LLGHELERLTRERSWAEVQRRRVELIRQDRESGLSSEEQTELERLQAEVDQGLAPLDQALLATAEQFRKLAEGLSDAKP